MGQLAKRAGLLIGCRRDLPIKVRRYRGQAFFAFPLVLRGKINRQAAERISRISLSYLEIVPTRSMSIATSLSAFHIRKLGFFNPH